MSMPHPIFVVLIASSTSQVERAKKHFRLSAPGIGAAYLAALDATPGNKIVPPSELPKGLITLWVALDRQSLSVARSLHSDDRRTASYGRGRFYEEYFPEPCVLVLGDSTLRESLIDWKEKIIAAWYASS